MIGSLWKECYIIYLSRCLSVNSGMFWPGPKTFPHLWVQATYGRCRFQWPNDETLPGKANIRALQQVRQRQNILLSSCIIRYCGCHSKFNILALTNVFAHSSLLWVAGLYFPMYSCNPYSSVDDLQLDRTESHPRWSYLGRSLPVLLGSSPTAWVTVGFKPVLTIEHTRRFTVCWWLSGHSLAGGRSTA